RPLSPRRPTLFLRPTFSSMHGALTSIREKLPGRPPVTDWLHGVSGWEPPETYVAWRKDVEIINPELQETSYIETQGLRVGKSGEVLQVKDKDSMVQEIR